MKRQSAVIASCVLFLSLGWAGGQDLAEQYLRQAEQLANSHEPLKAIGLLEQALVSYPGNPRMMQKLSQLYIRTGQLAKADSLLARALEAKPRSPALLQMKAELRFRGGQLDEAHRIFRAAIDAGGDSAAVRRQIALIHLLRNQDQLALEEARRTVELDPGDARHRFFLASLLDQNEQRDEAFRHLKIAYRLAPHDARILFHMAQRRKTEKRYAQALEYMELASEIDSENPLYHKELSELYDRLGLSDDAIRHANLWRTLLAAFEDYVRAVEISSQGRQGEAIAFLEESLAEVPEFVTGRLYLAELYQKRGRNDRALQLYLDVLQRNPAHQKAREEGAWLEVQRGNLDQAIDLLRGTAKTSPNLAYFEGYRLLLAEDWEGALEQLKRVEKDNPLNPDLLQLISYALSSSGKRKEAIRYLDKAGRFSRDGNSIRVQIRDIRFEEAREAMNAGRWEDALKLFQPLLEESGSSADIFFNAAYCNQRLGRIDPAVELYRTGLRMAPDTEWARFNLASSLYLRRRYKESSLEWERLLRSAKSYDGFFQLGMCYSHLTRLAEAEAAFSQALRLGGPRKELQYNLGLTRFRQGRQQSGMALIRQSAKKGYGPAVQFLQKAVRR